jgi:cobalamin biosynthesis Co2+ chelatase CbiK
MSAGFHFEKDIASEDSFLRRAFSDAGIRTQLIGGGILEVPEVRKSVADHCLGRIRKATEPRDAEK